MSTSPLTNSLLHHTILKYIVDHGFAPDVHDLAKLLNASEEAVTAALQVLADYHGVVLHPNQPKIWVIHPFSAAPTNFVVRAGDRSWWGNCAWCSLGVAALLKQDMTITTTLGADGKQVTLHIRDGHIVETHYMVHFPVPMVHAWDNVVYTCSTMLLFENEADVDRWSIQHRIARGDVQPIQTVWEFAKEWYGQHLNPDWTKWTVDEARDIFQRHGLTHPVWEMPRSEARF